MVPGFFQFQGRTARRLPGELQARNAHGPHRRVVRVRHPEKYFASTFKRQQQARFARVFHQLAGLGQRLAQRRFEFATEVRQLFAIIGIDHLQPQTATGREVRELSQNHADAVCFRQIEKNATRPLPGKDQLSEALPFHQALGAIVFGTDELGTGVVGFGFGVTRHVQTGSVLGDLGTDFTFEARPAVHKQGVHSILLGSGETFSRCAALGVSPNA